MMAAGNSNGAFLDILKLNDKSRPLDGLDAADFAGAGIGLS